MSKGKRKLLIATGVISIIYSIVIMSVVIYLAVASKNPSGPFYEFVANFFGKDQWLLFDSYGSVVREYLIGLLIALSLQAIFNIASGIYELIIATNKDVSLKNHFSWLLTIAILSLFLTSLLLPFILLLIVLFYKEEQKVLINEEKDVILSSVETKDSQTKTSEKMVEEVKKLKKLRDDGVISEEEYLNLLKKILL